MLYLFNCNAYMYKNRILCNKLFVIYQLLYAKIENKYLSIYLSIYHLGCGLHSGHIQSTHYLSEGEDKRIYAHRITNDMAAILYYSDYLLYNTSNLFWISSYMYICLISTHALLLYFGDFLNMYVDFLKLYEISQ